MFDDSLARPADLAGVGDVALIGAIAGWARAAAAAEARKLAAIAELERRRCGECEHPRWACDDLDAAAAEVSCALTTSHGRALGQIGLAVALRDRLPKVGARFLAGHLSPAMISTIVWRTAQVLDEVALARIDSEIAEHAPDWGPLSQYKLEQAIDLWLDRHDPDAVRRVRNTVRGRDFTVGHRDDTTGTASVYGRLTITDAVLLEQRIALMIASVCDDDPRTLGQRRADAVGAIAAGATHLMCRCDNPSCAAKVDDGRASNVTIHIMGDKEALDAAQDQKMHGRGIDPPPARTRPAKSEPEPEAESEGNEPEPVKTEPVKTEAKPVEPAEPVEPAQPPRPRTAALIPGAKGAIVPAPLLAELIAHGAKVRFVGAPPQCEDRYRPSTALQEFVRTRDLTCRFPGCDRPAVAADIDHTVPWPAGATHPANNKCYCRLHHLVKTFWDGWTDRQDPDGTIVVTTPTGLSYTTKPFSSLLFPQWNTTTPPPPAQQAATTPTRPGRHLMMPTRRRTRAQTRTARITAERRLNATERALIADRQADHAASQRPTRTQAPDIRPHPYVFHPAGYIPDYGDDPPPF